MERWLLTVESNAVDPSREKDLNDWYDKIHLPDILETPGFVRAVRYENTNPSDGQGKFVAMYEIETDDLAGTMAAFTEQVNSRAALGRMSDAGIAVGGALYRQITPPMEGVQGRVRPDKPTASD
jgi:hypothetical protein